MWMNLKGCSIIIVSAEEQEQLFGNETTSHLTIDLVLGALVEVLTSLSALFLFQAH